MIRLSFFALLISVFVIANAAPLESLNIPSSPEPTVEASPASSLEPSPESSPESSSDPINEGCVAIEHLDGYVLQHPKHLSRRVLCGNDFCATPNHAIIMNGVTTSMKQLCSSEWQCVESVKLVNNLDIFANRHAVVSDFITITPYDVRFPKTAVWIAQAVEKVWNSMFSSALVLLATLTGFLFLAQKNSKL